MSSAGARRHRLIGVLIIGALVVGCAYLGRVALLSVGATEGDVPPGSSLSLPLGSSIVSENTECASGGCWTTFEVRPPEGQSPAGLAGELGALPQASMPGNFIDPRTVWLWAEPHENVLILRADYWSSEWVP